MPVFFQQQINENTRIGIWKIEESEEYFRGNVPLHRDVTHPLKRVQHLAGRFLLQFLFPDFPYELIQIADTRKPFLPNASYHFSISHCGDYAAAIVSRENRVGIDIEKPVERILRLRDKFLSVKEKDTFNSQFSISNVQSEDSFILTSTLLWSAKEAVFKWFGDGAVDFREHIHLADLSEQGVKCYFSKTGDNLNIRYQVFPEIVLSWVMT